MKKILIASAMPWAFALAAERHIIRSHADDEVDMLDMFSICSSLSPHWRPVDRKIERLNRKIQRFVKPQISGRDITRDIDMRGLTVPPPVRSPAEIRGYRVGDARIGLGVLSSVSSITTIREPQTIAEYGAVYPEAWESAHRSAYVGEQVKNMGYDQIYIFNGRQCYGRPFCDVVQRSARITTYEQGGTGRRMIMADGAILEPHVFTRIVQEHPFDPAEGEAFYLERIGRKPGNEASFFTARMKTGHVPQQLAKGDYVAFFPSSSDEMAFIRDDPFYGEYPTQYDVAHALAGLCSESGKKLVVRLHPHLQHKNPVWRREWDFDSLATLGVLIIPPSDPCDTYALVRSSHCVVTCGSTVGFESSFMGVPNAIVGEAVGGLMGASVPVMTEQELRAFVAAPALPERALEQTMIYGSFNKVSGTLLEELDIGRHPNLARIDGRFVDPVRAAYQRLREIGRPPQDHSSAGFMGGKVVLTHLRKAEAEDLRADTGTRGSEDAASRTRT
jgi:hypothetical protein